MNCGQIVGVVVVAVRANEIELKTVEHELKQVRYEVSVVNERRVLVVGVVVQCCVVSEYNVHVLIGLLEKRARHCEYFEQLSVTERTRHFTMLCQRTIQFCLKTKEPKTSAKVYDQLLHFEFDIDEYNWTFTSSSWFISFKSSLSSLIPFTQT